MQTQIAGTRKKKTNRIHNVTLLRIRYFRKERWQLKTHVDASTQQVGARMRLADSRRRFIGSQHRRSQPKVDIERNRLTKKMMSRLIPIKKRTRQ
jgi:hypothetical protein